jgi:hypothetical protein
MKQLIGYAEQEIVKSQRKAIVSEDLAMHRPKFGDLFEDREGSDFPEPRIVVSGFCVPR